MDFGAATLVCTPASHDPFRRQRPSYTRAIDTQSARRTRRRRLPRHRARRSRRLGIKCVPTDHSARRPTRARRPPPTGGATTSIPSGAAMSAVRLALVPLAAAMALTLGVATPALAGKTLDAVKARGEVVCGVNTSAPGFSSTDSKGRWQGLDVDTCRAVAAAVLGSSEKVKFVPLNSQQRFAALQSGEIDILSRNTTWTLTRDASLGIVFAGINYYDGQGFMVPEEAQDRQRQEAQQRDRLRAGRHHQREERRRLLPRQRHEVQVGRVRHRRGDPVGVLRRPLPGLHHRHVRPRRCADADEPSPTTTRSCPRSSRRSRSGPRCAAATTTGSRSSAGRCSC